MVLYFAPGRALPSLSLRLSTVLFQGQQGTFLFVSINRKARGLSPCSSTSSVDDGPLELLIPPMAFAAASTMPCPVWSSLSDIGWRQSTSSPQPRLLYERPPLRTGAFLLSVLPSFSFLKKLRRKPFKLIRGKRVDLHPSFLLA